MRQALAGLDEQPEHFAIRQRVAHKQLGRNGMLCGTRIRSRGGARGRNQLCPMKMPKRLSDTPSDTPIHGSYHWLGRIVFDRTNTPILEPTLIESSNDHQFHFAWRNAN